MKQFEPPLRGSGSQDYSQDNGIFLPSSTNYSSSSIGEIQGDSIREIPHDEIHFSDHVAMWVYGGTPDSVLNAFISSFPHYEDVEISSANQAHRFIMPIESDSDALSFFNPWTYKYSLNYSTSTDEDGNEHIESIELIEEKEDVGQTTLGYAHLNGVFHINHNYPVSNEIRPVNTAVRYFIRAR